MGHSQEGLHRDDDQRARFRASLRDAVEGIDIVELQTGRSRSPRAAARRNLEAPAVLEMRRRPADLPAPPPLGLLDPAPAALPTPPAAVPALPPMPWSPARAATPVPWPPVSVLPSRAAAADAADPAGQPTPSPADIALARAVVAPLVGEIAALRAEVQRLQTLPAAVDSARRRDLVSFAAAVLIGLAVTVVVLALVLR